GRKSQLEGDSSAVARTVCESPALCLSQPARDPKSESRRLAVGDLSWKPIVWKEAAITLGQRHSRTAIADSEHYRVVIDPSRQLDWCAGWRMLECVVDEVDEYSERVYEIEATERERAGIVERNSQPIL